jgi:hypothetical protein
LGAHSGAEAGLYFYNARWRGASPQHFLFQEKGEGDTLIVWDGLHAPEAERRGSRPIRSSPRTLTGESLREAIPWRGRGPDCADNFTQMFNEKVKDSVMDFPLMLKKLFWE